MRLTTVAAAIVALYCASPAFAETANRDDLLLKLVTERHIPPVDKINWGKHVGADCVWVGRGLRVVNRSEVEGLQIDTGKSVEIQDFIARDYGDVAVLTYLVIERQPQAGETVTTRLRKMDTYHSQDGRWQLIANAEIVGRPDRKAVAVDPSVLDRYAGIYETLFDGKPLRTRIWRDGKRFLAQTGGQEPGELLPLSATVFFDATQPEEGGPENIFVLDSSGRAIEWIYKDGAVELRSRRVR